MDGISVSPSEHGANKERRCENTSGAARPEREGRCQNLGNEQDGYRAQFRLVAERLGDGIVTYAEDLWIENPDASDNSAADHWLDIVGNRQILENILHPVEHP